MRPGLGSCATCTVALRKESVDRNTGLTVLDVWALWSLSARRAWIEIGILDIRARRLASLSARRAWIEIATSPSPFAATLVALRKESVDRNSSRLRSTSQLTMVALRKESVDRNSCSIVPRTANLTSLSARRAWIEMQCKRNICQILLRRSPQGERG